MKEFHFANPDEIGSSEYRAIYDCLESGLEACDPDERAELAEAILETFIEHASAMLQQVREPNDQTEEDASSSSEPSLNDVPAEAAQQIAALRVEAWSILIEYPGPPGPRRFRMRRPDPAVGLKGHSLGRVPVYRWARLPCGWPARSSHRSSHPGSILRTCVCELRTDTRRL